MALDQKSKGIILAFGPVPVITTNGDHPGRMKALLNQVLQQAQSGKKTDDHQGKRLPEQSEHSYEDLYLFANVSKQFRSLRLKQPVLGKLLHRIIDTMDTDAAFLYVPQHLDYNHLEIRSDLAKALGPADTLRDKIQQLIAAGIRQCSGNYCIIDNSMDDDRFAALSDRPFRFAAVTVRHMKNSYGWLGLVSYAVDKAFKQDALNIMQTLANQLAVMMANMDQYDDLERFTVNIVCSLVNAIEAKDAYCQGHSKRVHQYVMQMARHLQLPAAQMEALKWAAVLHDIGKIGIPERILCKPGKLTEKEFDLIRQHPLKGKTILAPIRQLQPSMDAIAHHHERFDGSGYPEGLHGEAIPLAARIIAVADTYDAITSKRSYRASKTPQQALQVLDQVTGTQLDPRLVKLFKTACRELIDGKSGSEDLEAPANW